MLSQASRPQKSDPLRNLNVNLCYAVCYWLHSHSHVLLLLQDPYSVDRLDGSQLMSSYSAFVFSLLFSVQPNTDGLPP